LKPYTFPKPAKMTATNHMMHINRAIFENKVWEPEKLNIFEGSLFNPGITGAVIENAGTATAKVKVTFSDTVGDGVDKAIAVIYDEASGKALAHTAARQDGQIEVPIAIIDPADLSKLHAYLVFSQPPHPGNGESGQVSGTAYLKVPAPSGP
jgi:hypothetical protein